MIRAAVCDDEAKILDQLSGKIGRALQAMHAAHTLYATQSALSLVAHLRQEPADILFLDIDMPELDGMEIARILQQEAPDTLLIFVTHQEALVYESFRYHPFGFIRKRYFDQELDGILSGALERLRKRDDSFVFRCDGEKVRLRLSDILYFEADANYVRLFAECGTYRYRETLGGLDKELAGKGFIRIHKGFLVNQQRIRAILSDEVVLPGGRRLTVGRAYRESVREQLARYLRQG